MGLIALFILYGVSLEILTGTTGRVIMALLFGVGAIYFASRLC